MSLVALASTVMTNSGTFFLGCTDETNNRAIVVQSSNNVIRQYDLTTFTQVSSSTSANGLSGVALISAASAVCCSSNASVVQFYELSTGYIQSVAASNATNGKNQLIAGDTSTNVVMYLPSTANTIYRVNSNFTVTTLTINFNSGNDSSFQSIINIGSGRWLVGNQGGAIIEIDNSGNIINRLSVSVDTTQGVGNYETNSGIVFFPISNMAYDNNMLLVGGGDGTILVYDYSTGTRVAQYQMRSASQNNGIMFSPAASGEVVGISNVTASNPGLTAFEMDFTIKPLKFYSDGYIYTNSTSAPQDAGINTQTGVGWWLQTNSANSLATIYFYKLNSPRATTTRVFTLPVAGQRGRLALLDDTSGSTVGRPILDTYMVSPATYRVPTGKTIIEWVKVGEGEDATWGASSYST